MPFLENSGTMAKKGGGSVNKRKKVAMAAVTTAAAAGMVTGALFDTPAELMDAPEPDAVVEVLSDGGDDAAAEENRRTTPASRVKNWIWSLPAAVRLLVGVPLWTLGWVLLSALSALLGGAAPVVERLVSWLCLSLVLLAVFAASVKAALPDLPLKEILRPRNVAFIAILALMLGLADMVLPTVWQGYDARTQLVWRVGATCLLAFVCCAALSRHGKKPAAAAEPPRSQRTEVEKAAMALADSVCPKYKP